jgi:hypothetical protein
MNDLKEGSFVKREGKEYLVLKSNKTSFYGYNIENEFPFKVVLDKYKEKPRSYKLVDFCKDYKVENFKHSILFQPSERKSILSDKEVKTKIKGVSPCCGRSVYLKFDRKDKTESGKRQIEGSYRGTITCYKCGKRLNIIKKEDNGWISFSNDDAIYQINIETNEIRLLSKFGKGFSQKVYDEKFRQVENLEEIKEVIKNINIEDKKKTYIKKTVKRKINA